MKTTCRYCGIVDKPHDCPRKPKRRRTKNKYRQDVSVYNSKTYKQERSNIMDTYNNNCLWGFYVVGHVRVAEEVHHIIELMDNPNLGDEPSNMIPLSKDAHDFVHMLYKAGYKKETQELLRQFKADYEAGKYELGKYRSKVDKIVSPLGVEIF